LKKSLSLYVADKIGEENLGESEEDLSGVLKNGDKDSFLIQECLTAELDKKNMKRKKKQYRRRRKSIGDVEKLEDIDSLVQKRLVPHIKLTEEIDGKMIISKTNSELEEKKDEMKTTGKSYLAMSIKGYESDSALYEKHRVAIQA